MSAYFESLNRRMRVEPVRATTPPRSTAPRLNRLTPGEVLKGFAALAERLMVRGNGAPLRTLVFAGCGGGEGSTSVVLEFAESLAGSGMDVLLVDADLRTAGLTSGLDADGVDLVESVRSRQTPAAAEFGRGKLTIVPSPKVQHADKDRFFRSKEFSAWLDAQRGVHDYVLLDAPPLLHYADAQLMARLCDGVVIVVQAETTDREALVRGRQQLEDAGANVIGVVMNRVRNRVPPFLRSYVSME